MRRLKAGLVTAAAAGLIFGLSACGSSGSTASQPAMKSGSQESSSAASPGTPSPAAPSTSPAATPGSALPAAAGPGLITIKDFRYVISGPVAPGEKVMVRNEDTQSHTVTSGKGGFTVVVTGGGGSATFTAPGKAGAYPLACNFHGNMTGTLVVR